jgi:uncharacterized FAD-dependent dehydrogenase
MLRITELRLPLDHPEDALGAAIVKRLGIPTGALREHHIFRRGYDARRKSAIVLVYTVDCDVGDAASERAVLERLAGDPHVGPTPDTAYHPVAHAPADFAAQAPLRPVVIGFGPCGLFAALILAQLGLRPLVLERGKAVRERTRDTWGLWRQGVLKTESNVQFGEGGAGTFSDGKLWSQISDPRHLMRKVLNEFVAAGAPQEILYVSKPHIGTFRLVSMIEKMRAQIVRLGGEVRFGQQVVDLVIEDQHLRGLVMADGSTLQCHHAVLAPGHSARDTFEMLSRRGVRLQAKPFSIGFRIEHPQGVIDRARFGSFAGHPLLGAADYKLVHHARNGRSVYSFCMCPGGTVVAATSETHRVVTNGMSQYSRAERNANAGMVVGITPEDYRQPHTHASTGQVHPLDGIAFQRYWESRAYVLGGGDYRAPGQRVGDFLRGQASHQWGGVEPSYRPGVQPTDLTGTQDPALISLPAYAIAALQEALPAFDKQIPGFANPDAVLTGVETRTSSPVRIVRGPDRHSVNVAGLYPAGEGAGYAGGIMSAAVDGIETAEALALTLLSSQR